jgi:hypothetical protein
MAIIYEATIQADNYKKNNKIEIKQNTNFTSFF